MELDPKYDNYNFPTTSQTALSGHPGHLNPTQQAQVHQLRMMLEKEGYTQRLDTLTLLRFLRARKFDVQLSKDMFVNCEKWRAETKLDELVPTWEYPEKEEVFKYYPQYYHKTDKDGRPVYIEQLGKIDLKAMYAITSSERMLSNLAVEYERLANSRLPACSRKAGTLLETCCTIMDFRGVGLTKASQVYGYVREVSAMSQNYYPERLGRLYIINAPWGFSTVWSMVKGWLDPVTVQKIHILGSGYKADLLAQVPVQNLPREFGGECDCPGGCQLADMGPWKEEWMEPSMKDTPPLQQTTKTAEEAGANAIQNEGADVKGSGEAVGAGASAVPASTATAPVPVSGSAPAPAAV